MIIKGKITECTEHNKDGRTYYRVCIAPENPVELDGFSNTQPPIGADVLCSYRNGRVDDITIL